MENTTPAKVTVPGWVGCRYDMLCTLTDIFTNDIIICERLDKLYRVLYAILDITLGKKGR